MGDAHRSAPADLTDLVGEDPTAWNFFQLVRCIEARYADRPRIGDADRPSEELLRFGQRPQQMKCNLSAIVKQLAGVGELENSAQVSVLVVGGCFIHFF